MALRNSAALRFLYALPLVWLVTRLPVAIGDVSMLLNRRAGPATLPPPAPARKARARSIAANIAPDILSPRQPRHARGDESIHILPIVIESAALETPADEPEPQAAKLSSVATLQADQAWQLADSGYALLRNGRRREAAAMLRQANAILPNDGWRRDLGGLTSQWHGDAWAFARSGGGTALGVNAPALGQSQIGARIDYLFDPLALRPLIIEARLARPFRNSATQLAAGIGIRPLPGLPWRITAERQIATGRSTRDAWSLRAEGGVSAVPLPAHFQLDAYSEAGVVGARSADLFADGDLRATRPILPGISIGAGLWAASQPGARRVDIGPAVVGQLQQGRIGFSTTLDYRIRVTGNARPGSGPALTIAAGF